MRVPAFGRKRPVAVVDDAARAVCIARMRTRVSGPKIVGRSKVRPDKRVVYTTVTVSYTHLDVYKRQVFAQFARAQIDRAVQEIQRERVRVKIGRAGINFAFSHREHAADAAGVE